MPKTQKPRLSNLAELSSLLAIRNRPAGVLDGADAEPTDCINTNWSIVPANDNQPMKAAGIEMAVEITPSVDEIMRQVEDGSIEYGVHVDEKGKRHRVIVRIGKLRFSDGSQVERGHKLVAGQVVETSIKMPVGAMLGCRERETREKGAAIDASGSNAHFQWMIGKARKARPPKLTPKRGRRSEISKDEASAMLAQAVANTPVMPSVRYCPPGLPAQPTNLRQLFIGGQKGKNGESGTQAWQDIFVERERRDEYHRALESMRKEDIEILTAAQSAKSLKQIGIARGYRGQYAVEAGRRLLIAANDNFEQAMELAKEAAI